MDERREFCRIDGSSICVLGGDNDVFFYIAGMSIDADGACCAYHPQSDLGLDNLRNAGKSGNWWALVTDSGESSGTPLLQGDDDTAPEFYISATALADELKGSIVLAEAIGVLGNPRHGGTDDGVAYAEFFGSGHVWPNSGDEVRALAEGRFVDWCGLDRLRVLLPGTNQ